jgi:hypothetical protein
VNKGPKLVVGTSRLALEILKPGKRVNQTRGGMMTEEGRVTRGISGTKTPWDIESRRKRTIATRGAVMDPTEEVVREHVRMMIEAAARDDVGGMSEVRAARGDADGMTVPREGGRRGESEGIGPREIPVKLAIGAVITGGGENDQGLLLVKLRSW